MSNTRGISPSKGFEKKWRREIGGAEGEGAVDVAR
jgi:hypothetical protein